MIHFHKVSHLPVSSLIVVLMCVYYGADVKLLRLEKSEKGRSSSIDIKDKEGERELLVQRFFTQQQRTNSTGNLNSQKSCRDHSTLITRK